MKVAVQSASTMVAMERSEVSCRLGRIWALLALRGSEDMGRSHVWEVLMVCPLGSLIGMGLDGFAFRWGVLGVM